MRILIVVLCFLSAPLLHAAPIPLEHFTKHGDYLELKLSPDGEHLAARVRQEDTIVLLFIRRADRKVLGGVRPGSKNLIHSVTWVNNERVVYEYAEKQQGLDVPVSTGELFATNLDGKKRKHLYGYRASDEKTGSRISKQKNAYASQNVVSILEDDKNHILIIEYPWRQTQNSYPLPIVSKLNIYTGKKKKVERLPHYRARVVADKQGNVLFISWRSEDDYIRSAFRKERKDPWEELGTAFGIQKNFKPFALNNALTHAYLYGYTTKKSLDSVFELDLKTGKYSQIFDGITADIERTVKDPGTGTPVVAISYPDKHQYHYAKGESEIKELHRSLVASFPDQEVNITSKSKDGKQLLVHVSSDINPGEFFIFDTQKKNADFLWANRSWIDPRTMQTKTPIKFKARDGVEIHGYLTLPDKSNNTKSKPSLVVMLHGGPHGVRYDWSFDSIVQMFANNGYAVLQPNFRGRSGYGKKFRKLGYRQWFGAMINDMIDATNWVVAQGQVNGKKICTYGASYGGYASLMSAVRAPKLYQCSIGYVGVYDLNYMYSDSDITSSYGGNAYLKKVIGKEQKVIDEFSPINHVDKIEAKIMLIHGEEDERVSVKNTEDLAKKLAEAGKPAKTILYGQSAHGVYDPKNRFNLYQEVIKFLDENIGQ